MELTQETKAKVCQMIAGGSSLRKAAEAVGIAESTLRYFDDEDADFSAQYARAREKRANLWAEEFIEIADSIGVDGDAAMDRNAVERAKVRLDARKWVCSRILPKTYGDRVQQEHSGQVDIGLADQLRAAEERLKKL